MKCEVIHDLLSCYIDNACSDETRRIVDEHLKECEECRKLYEELSNVKYEIQPVINESKPFKKVKRHYVIKLLIILFAFSLLFIFKGSAITGTIVKESMKVYAKTHYPELNLEMTSFEYRDLSAQGFGTFGSKNFYYAEVVDYSQEGMQFEIFTDGFFLKITDNYDYKINQRQGVVWRLVDEYSLDAGYLLNHELGDAFIDCGVGLVNDYDYSDFKLNEKYVRQVDKRIPISLHVTLKDLKDEKQNQNTVRKLVSVLKENGFNTPSLTTSFISDEGYGVNVIPEIKNLKYI